jgi:putative endonuclease
MVGHSNRDSALKGVMAQLLSTVAHLGARAPVFRSRTLGKWHGLRNNDVMAFVTSRRLDLLQGFLRASDRLADRLGRRASLPKHLDTGRRGEEAAYFFLRRHGYIVVARGWRSGKLRGDLDLVAWENSTLCFVEVKTRSSRRTATAESAVDEEKSRLLRRMAQQYIRQLPSPPEASRFDILSIYMEAGEAADFELFRGAFSWY